MTSLCLLSMKQLKFHPFDPEQPLNGFYHLTRCSNKNSQIRRGHPQLFTYRSIQQNNRLNQHEWSVLKISCHLHIIHSATKSGQVVFDTHFFLVAKFWDLNDYQKFFWYILRFTKLYQFCSYFFYRIIFFYLSIT